MMLGTRDVFEYEECARCRSLQIAEVPGDLGRYYGDRYYSFEVARHRRRHALEWPLVGARRFAALRVGLGRGRLGEWTRWLRGVPGNARILDVGAGGGALLADLAHHGFANLTGVDPFLPSESRLGEDAGRPFRLVKAQLSDLDGEFDVVMLHHSLEHVADPALQLREVARLLAPTGIAVVRTPVAGCRAWREYGLNWVQLDAPRHLVVMSSTGLRAAAAAAGLDVESTQFDSTAFQFWGSALYERGVPLAEVSDPGAVFTSSELARWAAEANALNASGDGDQAVYVLRHARMIER